LDRDARHEPTKASCATSAQDTPTATMLAKKCHESVSVTSAQTPYIQLPANANGTMTYTSSAAPRWAKQNGSWVGVDASRKGPS
jgi:hypothetical protein